ncbi:MAG: histidine phosphatase family protein [Oscillospiraceae bacterium]|nr:histidine phosphatase family protein [Oscillospiraceae bacterium]
MKLLIIRHGESEADLMDIYEGRADFELTGRGHKQAELMSNYIKEKYHVSKIYCSPLKRAYQTAAYLSKKTGVMLITDDNLLEFNNGLIAGMKKEIADKIYPKVLNLSVYESVYEQESLMEFRLRADCFLSKILGETNENETVVIITHGGMINQLYHSFLCLPVESGISFITGETGIHCWNIVNGDKKIIVANYLEHLKG